MNHGREIISLVAQRQDLDQFRRKNWEGTFEEYLDIVRSQPRVTRNAFERIYDMILSYGTEAYEEFREKRIRYRFFSDPEDHGHDGVFGLDGPLWSLVNAFKSAAQGYGIEKRVLLLHGPVGSSKSTIARLLKKGLERYSAKDEGALYALGWATKEGLQWCPMNEEPLHLIPERFRPEVLERLNADVAPGDYRLKINGELWMTFRAELVGRVLHLTNLLDAADQSGLNEEGLNEMFRTLHTVKSASMVVPVDEITQTTHLVESLLESIRDDGIPWPKPLLADYVAWLAELSASPDLDQPAFAAAADLQARLARQVPTNDEA